MSHQLQLHYYLSKVGTGSKIPVLAISSAMLDALMSSSNRNHKEDSAIKEKLQSSPVSTTRDQTDSSSALRFTPVQIHKDHKKEKDDTDKRLFERKTHYTPDLETEETCRSRNKQERSYSSRTSDRDRSTDSNRISGLGSTQESRRSFHVSEQNLESDAETHRTSQSPDKCSFTDISSFSNSKCTPSPRNSHYTTRTSGYNSGKDDSKNASIYVTPEETPFSMRSNGSEEFQRHCRFKRSLSDEYNEESQSANSSFNDSCYYTPGSSPSQINPAKRLKIRWSSYTSYSLDNSSILSSGHNTSSLSDQGVQPELIGYQMVGDSQFCRFGQQLLGLARVPMPNCPGRIGICVSGQTITDLHRRVRENFYPISDKIILMIGTNDFLRNVEVRTMCEELSALIKTLQKSASNIILLTLPPIPKLEKKSIMHFKMLETYNTHIRSLENGETLRIADISPLYMTSLPHQRCRMHLFEMYFGGRTRRLDLIHLNQLGLEIIRKYILDKFI